MWGDEGGVPRRAEPLLLYYRRGQRLPTDSGYSPAPRVSARIRFAVRSLSEASDREINKVRRPGWHLIHRKRSPFPYEGKALMPPEIGVTANVGRDTSIFRRAECRRTACSRMFAASWGCVGQWNQPSSALGLAPHPPLTRSPFPSIGEGLMPLRVGDASSTWRRAERCRVAGPRAGAHLHERRRGEAHRRQGWVGGVHPSAPLKARTAASDGHCAFTRAARSAGLRFAVIVLSKTVDVGRDHLIHRKRSPFPYEGKDLRRLRWA